jgi:hypothetical protein
MSVTVGETMTFRDVAIVGAAILVGRAVLKALGK